MREDQTMRVQRYLTGIICLGLAAALMGAAPRAAAVAACAAPITPGAWSGTFNRPTSAQVRDSSDPLHPKTPQLSETLTGSLALQVTCDAAGEAALTGSISNETLNLQIVITTTNTKSNLSQSMVSTCTGAS